MKKIIAASMLSLSCCSSETFDKTLGFGQQLPPQMARVTYYNPSECHWGSEVACPKTRRAKEGVTIAAHPDFYFGQKIFIPELKGVIGNGEFLVQDRGSAVTRKKASKGKTYVFDVFVRSGSSMRKHAKKNSEYMEVFLIE